MLQSMLRSPCSATHICTFKSASKSVCEATFGCRTQKTTVSSGNSEDKCNRPTVHRRPKIKIVSFRHPAAAEWLIACSTFPKKSSNKFRQRSLRRRQSGHPQPVPCLRFPKEPGPRALNSGGMYTNSFGDEAERGKSNWSLHVSLKAPGGQKSHTSILNLTHQVSLSQHLKSNTLWLSFNFKTKSCSDHTKSRFDLANLDLIFQISF